MPTQRYDFDAALWVHDGPAAWYFISLPENISDEIEALQGPKSRGFGSVRVEVTIGSSIWKTSIFPDNKRATYILPVKKAVRTKEQLVDGAVVTVALHLID